MNDPPLKPDFILPPMRRTKRLRLFGVLALPEPELARASRLGRARHIPPHRAARSRLDHGLDGPDRDDRRVRGDLPEAPGLAIALWSVSCRPGRFTEIKAARRRRRDEPMSSLERVLWIVGLTILIPIVVITALVVALFTFCMFMSR